MSMVQGVARVAHAAAGDAVGGRWAAYELVLRRLSADDRLPQ